MISEDLVDSLSKEERKIEKAKTVKMAAVVVGIASVTGVALGLFIAELLLG